MGNPIGSEALDDVSRIWLQCFLETSEKKHAKSFVSGLVVIKQASLPFLILLMSFEGISAGMLWAHVRLSRPDVCSTSEEIIHEVGIC